MQWESIWLERIRSYWHMLNSRFLQERLRPPTFRLDSALRTLGTYQPSTRTLSISREHLQSCSWESVQETIRHETAHQVVEELLGGGDGKPHGKAFKRALSWLESPESEGEVSPEPGASIRRRIEKLLALAESDNVHEARRAMETANLLLLRYNLKEVGTQRYTRRRLGDLRSRIPLDWKLIGAVLGEFFFVECVWTNIWDPVTRKDKRQLEILGTEANVEMAEYVHGFLHGTLERLVRSRVREGRKDARSYRAGVILGFQERLRANQLLHQEEGLVWVGDPDLEQYVKEAFPRLRSMRATGVGRNEALAAGKHDGKSLILSKPIARGSTNDPPKRLN